MIPITAERLREHIRGWPVAELRQAIMAATRDRRLIGLAEELVATLKRPKRAPRRESQRG